MAELQGLEPFPEDWTRALAVVAHPDDMEYGAAGAVARWTAQGRQVAYTLVTDGEAGITTMAPEQAGPLRRQEQRDSCAIVGVTDVQFLGLPDGLLEEGLSLRRTLTGVLRRHRPEVVLSINFRDSWGGPSWNHVDHRVVGRTLLDAVRDTANPWVFTDQAPAWDGIRFVAFSGSPQPTHAVDITGSFDVGVRSLMAHRAYLANLGGAMADPGEFLRGGATAAGARLGVALAAAFEIIG